MSNSNSNIFIPNPNRKIPQIAIKVTPAHVAAGVTPFKKDTVIRPAIQNAVYQDGKNTPLRFEQTTFKKIKETPELIKTEGVGKNLSENFTGDNVFIPASPLNEEEKAFSIPFNEDFLDLKELEKAEENINNEVIVVQDKQIEKKVIFNKNIKSNLNSFDIVRGEYFIIFKEKIIFKSKDFDEVQNMLTQFLFDENSPLKDINVSELEVYKKFNFEPGVILK